MRDHNRETPWRARPACGWSEFRTAPAVALSCNTLINFALQKHNPSQIRIDKYRKGAPRSTEDRAFPPGRDACGGPRLRSNLKLYTLYCKVAVRPAPTSRRYGVPSVTDGDRALHYGLGLLGLMAGARRLAPHSRPIPPSTTRTPPPRVCGRLFVFLRSPPFAR